VKAGGLELIRVADIPGDIEGDSAASVRNTIGLIQHDDVGVGLQPFETTGGFGAQGYGPDNDNGLSHVKNLLKNKGRHISVRLGGRKNSPQIYQKTFLKDRIKD
jgi:hypothetical protein